jgi:uncharacterized membrane protein required for colicin V production
LRAARAGPPRAGTLLTFEEWRVDVLAELSWLDLVIIGVLAAGVFVGFTQGAIRYALNSVAVVVSFVLAAQLQGPIFDLLRFWDAFSPEGRRLLIFMLLFVAFVVASWFGVRALYRRTQLPIPKALDEILGAVLGMLWVALIIVFHLVILDSFFLGDGQAGGWLAAYYDAMSSSLLVQFLRDILLPTAGFLARPFVPSEIADLLEP